MGERVGAKGKGQDSVYCTGRVRSSIDGASTIVFVAISGSGSSRRIWIIGPDRARRITIPSLAANLSTRWPSIYVPLVPRLTTSQPLPWPRISTWCRDTTALYSTTLLSFARPMRTVESGLKDHFCTGVSCKGCNRARVITRAASFSRGIEGSRRSQRMQTSRHPSYPSSLYK